MDVEKSFGRLKGRWRCLLKRLDFKLCHVVDVVAVCTLLHNVCQLYGDEHLKLASSFPIVFFNKTPISTQTLVDNSRIRNAIMQYLIRSAIMQYLLLKIVNVHR